MATSEDKTPFSWRDLIPNFRNKKTDMNVILPPMKMSPQADITGGNYQYMFGISFDGEKNLGEIGPIKNWRLNYDALRMRSWQSYLESEITQTVLQRDAIWTVGKGLKLCAEPSKLILAEENIKIDPQEFSKIVEGRFEAFRKSKRSDHAGMKSLNKIAKIAYKNAIVGGDVLVIQRYENNNLNVQLIDGAHVQSPFFGTEVFPQYLENGNKIINGVEVDPTGNHVAYYVKNYEKDGILAKPVRIPTKIAGTDLYTCFLVKGLDYRIDNHRGMPLIAVLLETIAKLNRYKEATVGSAEERQKIAFAIEHSRDSTGESPLNKNLVKAFDWNAAGQSLPTDIQGKTMADTVAVSTNKQAFNMPIGATLKMLESKNELFFKDFYTVNIQLICAACGIPPEVALSKYDSNFSASRAALKDWEHTLAVKRQDFGEQFYQPIYDFFLDILILKGKVNAPGYLIARQKGNSDVLEAYRNARFIGVPVPHIDPLKEVKAIREKLGPAGAYLPLTTMEDAIADLGGGESDHVLEQFALELEKAKKLKIEAPTPIQVPAPGVTKTTG